jgi:2-polyprenyl-6-hydroxyphenyl methylase/3-demethylubiquinone-9 3-methyltransferase
VDVRGKTILDIGCGGGILSQALARKGGKVTGIDLNTAALTVARIHAKQSGHAIGYFHAAAEDLAESFREAFDIVACMEVLEHVPRPQSIVNACKKLVKPGGHVFFATLNRTWTAYLLAIVTAEYILRIVGKGTHAYKRFIKPRELSDWAGQAGLTEKDLSGIRYIPFGPICYLNKDTRVNYMMYFKNEEMGHGRWAMGDGG